MLLKNNTGKTGILCFCPSQAKETGTGKNVFAGTGRKHRQKQKIMFMPDRQKAQAKTYI